MNHVKSQTVTVRVPSKMTLKQAQEVLASVLNKTGCPTCYSGRNISFVNMGDPAPIVLNVEEGSLKVSETAL